LIFIIKCTLTLIVLFGKELKINENKIFCNIYKCFLSKKEDIKSNSHFSKISKLIVDAFPRLVLSLR